MRKKLLLSLLLLACFFTAWIGVSYAKMWFFDRDESSSVTRKPEANTTVASEQNNAFMLPLVFNDLARSEIPLNIEALFGDFDMDSLDGILMIKDRSFRRLAMNDYLNKLPLSEFPGMINDLIKQIADEEGNESDELLPRKREYLGQMISVWFERDFERAKVFVLSDKMEEENDTYESDIPLNLITDDFGLNSVYKNSFRGYLLVEWMKRDKAECLEFLKTNTSDKGKWTGEFILMFSRDYPRECYSLLEENPEHCKDRLMCEMLFSSWYDKEGDTALKAILNISSSQERKKALGAIIRSIAWKNPNQAVDLIRKEYPSDNGLKPYFLFETGRSVKEEDYSGLDMIRQGNFSDVERKALVRGYISGMSLTSVNELLENTQQNFSQEERFMLIKERLCSAISYQTGTSTTHMDMVSISEEESHLALQLFRELSLDEQEVVCVNRLDADDKKLSLFMYNELPPEKQLNATRQKLFEGLIQEDVIFAGEYFLEHFHDGSLITQDVKLGNVMFSKGKGEGELLREIIDRYSARDMEGAETWATSIPDKGLREMAMFLLSAASWKGDPVMFVSQLNEMKDEKLVKSVLDSIVSDESYSDPHRLLPLVNGVHNAALAQGIVDSSVDHFFSISSDAIFDFIDGLQSGSSIQEYTREKFYDEALEQDPKLALEIALDMPPGNITEARIQRALSAFQRETPERAARWLKENNIKLSQ